VPIQRFPPQARRRRGSTPEPYIRSTIVICLVPGTNPTHFSNRSGIRIAFLSHWLSTSRPRLTARISECMVVVAAMTLNRTMRPRSPLVLRCLYDRDDRNEGSVNPRERKLRPFTVPGREVTHIVYHAGVVVARLGSSVGPHRFLSRIKDGTQLQRSHSDIEGNFLISKAIKKPKVGVFSRQRICPFDYECTPCPFCAHHQTLLGCYEIAQPKVTPFA